MKKHIFWTLQTLGSPHLGGRMFIVALFAVGLSYGVIAGHFNLWPSQLFKRAYLGLLVLTEQNDGRPRQWREFWVDQVRKDEAGVTRYNPTKAYHGYTLFSSIHEAGAVVIDMQGREVHRWHLNEEALKQHLGLKSGQLTELAWFDQVKALPDGRLWALVMTYDAVSNPAGLVLLNRNSKVEWAYRGSVHHDFDISVDGTIFILTYGMSNISREISGHLDGPAIMDYIDVVGRDGTRIKRISILNCILRSKYRPWLDREEIVASSNAADVLHTNAIRLVSHEDWKVVPSNGHTHALISIRDPHLIGIIDLDEERLVHVVRGPWLLQHDPDLLPDGTILLFDNWGRLGAGSRSRVLRFNPSNGRITWQWPKDAYETLDSRFRGSQQLLPNGNVLITESHGGRIIEVDSNGDVVWEYYSPFRQGKNREFVPIVRWGQRINTSSVNKM